MASLVGQREEDIGARPGGVIGARRDLHEAPARDMALAGAPGALERLFAVVALLLLSGAVLPLLTQNYPGDTVPVIRSEPPIWTELVFPMVYLTAVPLLMLRAKDHLRWLFLDMTPWGLILIAIVTITWSDAPFASIRQSVLLVGATLTGIYLATCYERRVLLRLLGWAFAFAAALSYIVALIAPELGISEIGWRGAYVHKNTLGGAMVLGTLVFLILPTSGPRRVLVRLAAVFPAGLVVLSSSQTALVSLIVVVLLLVVVQSLRLQPGLAFALVLLATALGILGALWLVQSYETVLSLLGRDSSLTGRTDVWAAVLEMTERQPMGYGYKAFWRGWGSPAEEVWMMAGWRPFHSHNGFLDLLLDVGVVGLLVFIAGALRGYYRATKVAAIRAGAASAWPMVLLCFVVVTSTAEISILTPDTLYWVLFVAVLFDVAGAGTTASAAGPVQCIDEHRRTGAGMPAAGPKGAGRSNT